MNWAQLAWPFAVVGGATLLIWLAVHYLRKGAVASQQAKDTSDALKTSEEISDAQSRVHPPTVTSDWLRRPPKP